MKPCSSGLCGSQEPAISSRDRGTLFLPFPLTTAAGMPWQHQPQAHGQWDVVCLRSGTHQCGCQGDIHAAMPELDVQTLMPITMKGAPYTSGMRDDSKSSVQGVQALVGHIHIYICIPPLQPPPLSCTLLLSPHPVPSLTFSHMPWEWLQPPTLPSDV